jgi:hypothetical protein
MQDYEETRTNPYGFFSDTKSAVILKILSLIRQHALSEWQLGLDH